MAELAMPREDWLPEAYDPADAKPGPLREDGHAYPGKCSSGDHEGSVWMIDTDPPRHLCRPCIRTQIYDGCSRQGFGPPLAFYDL